MKVKRYKGNSLEKLYSVISKELGPDAVVVSPEQAKRRKGILGRNEYELIGIADDGGPLEASRIKKAILKDIDRMSGESRQQWQQVVHDLAGVREELSQLSSAVNLPATSGGEGLPAFARNWERRFVRMVKQRNPRILREDSEDRVNVLSRYFSVQEEFEISGGDRPHSVVFSGPTGSGKTTTLAKLAADWSIRAGLNVGIITADTYRVAAVDQIKEYATLLGLELRVVFSVNEAAQAVDSLSDKDVILIDTPGKNFYDKTALTNMKGMLRTIGPNSVFLLVPAVLSASSVSGLISSYNQSVGIDNIIVTKVDEVRDHSVFTAIASETDTAIIYLTDGQEVPKDIRSADAMQIASMVIGKGEV